MTQQPKRRGSRRKVRGRKTVNELAVEAAGVAARLNALLPELEHSRETHVQWRDCEQSHRDENPKIGDAAFHAQAVRDYDERIAAIREAKTLIERQARRIEGLQEFVDDLAGNDCREYDKHLNPKPCGKCLSCRARAALEDSHD